MTMLNMIWAMKMLSTILSISAINLDFFALNFAPFFITFVSDPTYRAAQITSLQFLKLHPRSKAFSFEIDTN